MVELTAQTTVEEIISEKERTPLSRADPYPDKTPKHVLERQYLLSTVTLDGSGTITSFRPIDLLLAVPTISEYLKIFRYIRCGIRLEFLMVSTVTQYGVVSISRLPYQIAADAAWKKNNQQLSQANMLLLNVSRQEGAVVELPYLSPKLFLDLSGVIANQPSWRIDLKNLFIDTTTVGTTSSVVLKVFGSLTDVETSGYLSKPAVFQCAGRTIPHRIQQAAAMATAGLGYLNSPAARTTAKTIAATGAAIKSGVYVYDSLSGEPVPLNPEPAGRSEPASTSVRMEVAPDLSTPSMQSVRSKLGDDTVAGYVDLPTIDNVEDLTQACQLPTLMRIDPLSAVTPLDISLDPFTIGTYCSYISPMYKYYRGGTKVMVMFETSPMVSGRVKITLFPAQAAQVGSPDYGDLPQWVVSVSGSEKFCLEVPYLKTTPWSLVGGFFPTLRIELVSPLPQPFDKTVHIYALTFLGVASDFKFAGLQSFIPSPAVFQCDVRKAFGDSEHIGTTQPHPYQGGVSALSNVLGRYSSRTPSLTTTFPFPIKILDWDSAAKLDNFDYICNLFMFYTGNVNVRMLFSKGATNGLLRSSVSNSNTSTSTISNKWKSSNSMAMTDQTVWPMLEYEYPYLNECEFDSIYRPNGMFSQELDSSAVLNEMFLSAGSNFRLMYLMPVPDWFTVAKPVPPPAMFQSYPRYQAHSVIGGSASATTTTGAGTNLGGFDFSKSFTMKLQGSALRTAGTNNQITFQISVTTSNASPVVNGYQNGVLMTYSGIWSDPSNNGQNSMDFKVKGSFAGFAALNQNLYVWLKLIDPVTAPTELRVYFNIQVSAYSGGVFLTSPYLSTETAGSVDANITGSAVSTDVNATIVGATTSIPVTQSGIVTTDTTIVGATLNVPVDVKSTTPVAIAGSVAVTGTQGGLIPVYTSLYPTS